MDAEKPGTRGCQGYRQYLRHQNFLLTKSPQYYLFITPLIPYSSSHSSFSVHSLLNHGLVLSAAKTTFVLSLPVHRLLL